LSFPKKIGAGGSRRRYGPVAIDGFDRRMSFVWKNTNTCELFGIPF
jgi:hypothetical protein